MKSLVILLPVLLIAGCSTPSNRVFLKIDSAPQGALVYQDGTGCCGRTPYTTQYVLRDVDYYQGCMVGTKFTIVYPGAYPEEYTPVLKLNPLERPDPHVYSSGGKRLNLYKLIVFRAPENTPSTGQQNINVYNKKDDLDSLNGGLDALLKLRALGPIR